MTKRTQQTYEEWRQKQGLPTADPSEHDPRTEVAHDEETPEEWWSRQDDEDGRPHDANESRTKPKWTEDYDPNMGCC